MSADQLRRAADVAKDEWAVGTRSPYEAVAALLRAAADFYDHREPYARIAAILKAADDVAAAYLGEEPQP